MDEYIRRKDGLEKVKSSILVPADNEWDSGYNTAMAEMLEFIKQLPAVDVKPVKHGCWITSHPVDVAKEFKCIVCGGLIELPVFAKHCYYDYCPNCGARMDGNINE